MKSGGYVNWDFYARRAQRPHCATAVISGNGIAIIMPPAVSAALATALWDGLRKRIHNQPAAIDTTEDED